ncbi:hypothetical protein F4680DRAFT_405274 [Xylaria scruposa]|nr:hypothetical protein F4680DRAFT_405274 [Xylaria scruposa]
MVTLTIRNGRAQPSEPPLDCGNSCWQMSSQRAADLYDAGVLLWRKEDLMDIERQLAQSCTTEMFTVRRIDGSIVNIENPMFGVQKPIWKPSIKFQEYWNLVYSRPLVMFTAYNCTCLIDWTNQVAHNDERPIENFRSLFETSRQQWNASADCEALKSQFRKLLGGDGNAKKVTKIICFGLGDMDSEPSSTQTSKTIKAKHAFRYHAIALTIAGIARSCTNTGDMGVRLLTQGPMYSDGTKDVLREIGFEVVGEHGAGGFAELDDESIVISPSPTAPVKQIIADLARPVAIICTKKTNKVFHNYGALLPDPESPRTWQMWKDYDSWEFPVFEDSVLPCSFYEMEINARMRE